MKTEDSMRDGIIVLTVSGGMLGGIEITRFHGLVQQYLSLNKRDFVIDLAHVDRISSIGLGMLTSAYSSIKRAGGRMTLANVTGIESILSLTRLLLIFEIHDNLDQALAAHKAAPLAVR